MSKVKIVAAVVDTTEITLYKEDGETITILQGDPRVPVIVDQVLPIVEKGGTAEVDLSTVTHYGEFEELVQGAIQFFRVAKTVLERVLTRQDIPAGQFGPVPRMSHDMGKAVNEIIANANSSKSEEFHASDLGTDETVVAVVETDEGKVAIPGAEKLEELFAYSAKNRNTVGVQNLMKRMAKMIGKRQHSVEDLLRFLEKADMPIADDGSIIAYKILRHGRTDDTFVDCHTKKVTQKVGSYVCVAESLVDKNRRNECSSGLHVARRGYIGTFGGDSVTLIKVDPEDVIVVPHNDANKVRVCGYHILAVLPEGAYNKLKNNRPMTDDPQVARLLAQVLKGNHVERLERVEITEQHGGGVVITQLVNGRMPKTNKTDSTKAPQARALDDPKEKTRSVDPREVAEKVAETKGNGNARQQKARDLMNTIDNSTDERQRIETAQQLVAFKKAAKVSWDNLRIGPSQAKEVMELAKQPLPSKPSKPSKVQSTPANQSLPAPKAAPVEGTRQEKAAALMGVINSTASITDRGLAADNLMALKRSSKISYEKLGVTMSEDQLKAIARAGKDAEVVPTGSTFDTPPSTATAGVPAGNGRQQQARELFNSERWSALALFKKSAKVGWDRLGFTPAEIALIKSKI